MKKTILVFAFFIIGLHTSAQEYLTSYFNNINGEWYEVRVSFDNKGKFSLLVDATSEYITPEFGGFWIKEKKYDDFIASLKEAKLTYEDWKKKAIASKVPVFNKREKMNVTTKIAGYFYHFGKWKYQNTLEPSFEFITWTRDEVTKYYLGIRSGEMTENKQYYIDGVEIIFSSSQQIQDFIDSISLERIQELKDKLNGDGLFKY